MKPRRDPPTLAERLVLFGGPALFIVLVVVAWRSLLGPSPHPNAVRLLKSGVVRPGDSYGTLIDRVGPPNHETSDDRGRRVATYVTTTWNEELRAVFAEDADVAVGEDGRVESINFASKKLEPTSDDQR